MIFSLTGLYFLFMFYFFCYSPIGIRAPPNLEGT